MLSNVYLLAKFRFDTAENERNSAENLPKTDSYPTDPTAPVQLGRAAASRAPAHGAARASFARLGVLRIVPISER